MSAAEIERKALELLCKLNAESRPIDVMRIANALGISVFEASFENDSISGLIRKEADGVKIYYNRAHNFRRIRFTIAHEIGHYVLGHLDKVRNQQIDDFALNMFRRADGVGGKDYQMEVDANKFAAALLMPEKLVVQSWQETGGDIEKMAEQFRVSCSAMGYRVDHLDSRKYARP